MEDERKDHQGRAGGYIHADAMVDEALDWFVRLQDEDTLENRAAFAAWEASDARRRQAFDELLRMQGLASLHMATIADIENRRPAALRSSLRRSTGGRRLGYAAMAALLLAAVSWQELPGLLRQWQSDYHTAAGEQLAIALPDGSTVMLNTASAIALDFDNGARRVRLLDGEAYFDVRHDPAHPFVVTGGFSDVEVMGTAFGVQAEAGRDTIVLERGRIEVTRRTDRREQTMLQPGQMLVATGEGLSAVASADAAQTLAWRGGRIVFHDRSFDSALSDLRRYYDGQVVVVSARPRKELVSGNYRIDDPEAAIRTLAALAGMSVTRLPGGVLILL